MMNRRQWLGAGAASLASGLPQWTPAWAAAAPGPAAPLSAEERALHALNRLAFGPRPSDAAAIRRLGAGPWLEAFLAAQLNPASLEVPAALAVRLAGWETLKLSQAALIGRYREATQANRIAKREAASEMASEMASGMAKDGADPGPAKTAENARREWVRPVVLQASSQRLLRALDAPPQLEEVLVDFWFNHFNVFVGKGPVAVLVGSYEREAIRPHVLGNFRTLLGATAKHPAMLIYLDNVQSVAPGYAPPARFAAANPNRPTGLNENYARELMELHTLGVDGGYSQRDVTELARMLTGWTVDYRALQRPSQNAASGSMFIFDPRRHDSGSKQWLGRNVRPDGQAEGELALDVLAAHPATARHLSFKLAQAFVADQPPPALVDRLTSSFLASKGDLKAVMQALLGSDEFWSREAYGAKFKTPYQYVLSSLRAIDAPAPTEFQPLIGALAQAGMPLYGAQTPDGYKNTAGAWMNAEALAQRIQLATTLGERRQRRAGSGSDEMLATLGPLISPATRQTVAAEPAAMQTALLLGSPDFMRR
ncbi:DUF1800 domain-containing protein [soil metagenome]